MAMATLSGCTATQPSDQEIRQRAADAAQQARLSAARAAQQARVALEQARRTSKNVVAGARQGWAEGKPVTAAEPLDLNSASETNLKRLPGISPATARRIVNGRPYSSVEDLRKKRIVSAARFDRIRDQITVNSSNR